ncbi:MAG TPA: NfeD family protein [Acidimicrobiales bacterium]
MPSVRCHLGPAHDERRLAPIRRRATAGASRFARGRLVGALALMMIGLVLAGAAGQGPAGAQEPGGGARVLRAEVDGGITPVTAGYLTDAVGRAEDGAYDALVIEIDTPGGLDTSMRDIIQELMDADVPVIGYVSPQGARAGSAGALIVLSTHVAAMAPGTAIGASTPVDLEGGEVSDKIVNDAAAYAEAIAEERGRNVEVAVDMVREGRSLAVGEAVDEGAVDLASPSLADLLDEVDGREVAIGADERPVTLRTADAVVDDYEMGLFRRIQQTLADPNLAFLFMSIGTLGLIYELASPGVGVGGVLGLSMVLLGLFSLSVLPVNAVGIVFLLLAAALFVAELFAPGIGIAAAGGVGALILAGIFLFRDTPGFTVSMAVVAPVAIVVGGAVILAGRLVVRSRRSETRYSGPGVLVGKDVVVQGTPPDAQAFVEGAWWTVRSVGDPLVDGSKARVIGVDGLVLEVEPLPSAQVTSDNQGHEP